MLYCKLFSSLLIGFSLVNASSTNAAILLYDENNDGTLSTDNLNPTDLSMPSLTFAGGPLPIGTSSVQGAIESALFQRNIDVFKIQVAPGTKLTEIRIPDYSSADDIAVLGINNDSFFPFDPSTFNNTLTLIQLQQIIGVAQFGTGWTNTVNLGARDLLASVDPNLTNANLIGSRTSGFKPFETYGPSDKFDELGPGTYTVYMQQTGDNTQYQIDFTVVATIPEPTSLALVGMFTAAASIRRRR